MKNLSVGNRIIIVGCSGSGKSTLARRLQERTGLPLIHLDNVWWKADRTHITRDEFDRKLEMLIKSDKWIIDGDYSRTYEMRICTCDTIIFLDYSEEVCMKGITERIGKTRADIPWVEDQLNPELVEFVRNYQKNNRPVLYMLIDKYPKKQVLIFKTRSQAEKWMLQEPTNSIIVCAQ